MPEFTIKLKISQKQIKFIRKYVNIVKENNELQKEVKKRLDEFKEIQVKKHKSDWIFTELCFCFLAAQRDNDKAKQVWKQIRKVRNNKGFLKLKESGIKKILEKNKFGLHNKISSNIVKHRNNKEFKQLCEEVNNKKKDDILKREWLVEKIEGFNRKEASHFLRNIGATNLAILDRHVLGLLYQDRNKKDIDKIIKRVQNNKKYYINVENQLKKIKPPEMSLMELDFYLFSLDKMKSIIKDLK